MTDAITKIQHCREHGYPHDQPVAFCPDCIRAEERERIVERMRYMQDILKGNEPLFDYRTLEFAIAYAEGRKPDGPDVTQHKPEGDDAVL